MAASAAWPTKEEMSRALRKGHRKVRSYQKLVRVTAEQIHSYNDELREIYGDLVRVGPRNRAMYLELSRRMEFKIEILENLKSLYAGQVQDLQKVTDDLVYVGVKAFDRNDESEVNIGFVKLIQSHANSFFYVQVSKCYTISNLFYAFPSVIFANICRHVYMFVFYS